MNEYCCISAIFVLEENREYWKSIMERAAASGQPFMFAARSNAFMGEFEFKIA